MLVHQLNKYNVLTIFFIPAEGALHILGMIAVDPWDFHATQLYILAEVLIRSLSVVHEAALFSHTGRGSSLRFKYTEMGRGSGDCAVISYKRTGGVGKVPFRGNMVIYRQSQSLESPWMNDGSWFYHA